MVSVLNPGAGEPSIVSLGAVTANTKVDSVDMKSVLWE
jgi:hypothetical protein